MAGNTWYYMANQSKTLNYMLCRLAFVNHVFFLYKKKIIFCYIVGRAWAATPDYFFAYFYLHQTYQIDEIYANEEQRIGFSCLIFYE